MNFIYFHFQISKTVRSLVIIILLLVFAVSQLMAANTEFKTTEIKVFRSDSTFKYLYYYDHLGRKVSETRYFKTDELNFKPLDQHEWFYDDNFCTGEIFRKFQGAGWMDSWKIERKQSDGKLLDEKQFEYQNGTQIQISGTSNTFHNGSIVESVSRSYAGGALKGMISKKYSISDGLKDTLFIKEYQNDNQIAAYAYVYTYNELGNKLSSTLYSALSKTTASRDDLKFPSGEIGEPVNKTIWNYSGVLPVSQKNLEWNQAAGRWNNLIKTVFEYDKSGNLTFETYSEWKGLFWIELFRYNYSYNANSEPLTRNLETPVFERWRTLSNLTYNRDPGALQTTIESVWDFWGGSKGESLTAYIPFTLEREQMLLKADKLEISYVETDLNQPQNQTFENAALLFPNPSSGLVYFDNSLLQPERIRIYSMNGQLIMDRMSPFNSSTINLYDLPNGNYMVLMNSGGLIHRQKLILVK